MKACDDRPRHEMQKNMKKKLWTVGVMTTFVKNTFFPVDAEMDVLILVKYENSLFQCGFKWFKNLLSYDNFQCKKNFERKF